MLESIYFYATAFAQACIVRATVAFRSCSLLTSFDGALLGFASLKLKTSITPLTPVVYVTESFSIVRSVAPFNGARPCVVKLRAWLDVAVSQHAQVVHVAIPLR